MNTIAGEFTDAQLRDLTDRIRRARFQDGTKIKVTPESVQMLDMKGRPLLSAILQPNKDITEYPQQWMVQVSLDIAGLMGLELERDR